MEHLGALMEQLWSTNGAAMEHWSSNGALMEHLEQLMGHLWSTGAADGALVFALNLLC